MLLLDAGADVTIYERSPTALDARGAGIAVLEQTLRYPVTRLGLDVDEISTRTGLVRFLERDGSTSFEEERENRFSAWNRLYRVLHDAFPADRYVLGSELTNATDHEKSVSLTFKDGAHHDVDLLVCADGIGSDSRRRLCPNVTSTYAGYVGWRGTVAESALSPATRDALGEAITYQVLPRSHILVYPIPGPDGSVTRGDRLINMVWYRNVAAHDLPGFLTDSQGRQREVSVPPGHVRDDVVAELRQFAADHLAAPLAEMVTSVPEPFVQAVFDIAVPRMRAGRSCLIGDAAFAVRPHAAAGTAKAAEDGWVLWEELVRPQSVDVALAQWESRQLALGSGLLARNREIGESSQVRGDFRAGDPRHLFGLYGPGR